METWNESELTEEQISRIVTALQLGQIVVLPFGHTHIFLADAFSHLAVNRIQMLRNAPEGTALSVMVSSLGMLGGISQNITDEMMAIGEKFWPGPLTALLTPNLMLNWNLGDDGELPHFAVRIPDSKLLLSIIEKSGPVVFANANYVGAGPIKSLQELDVRPSDIGIAVQGGNISEMEVPSTVIAENRAIAQNIEIMREGAISTSAIEELLASLVE